jgi:hypothetical protein
MRVTLLGTLYKLGRGVLDKNSIGFPLSQHFYCVAQFPAFKLINFCRWASIERYTMFNR